MADKERISALLDGEELDQSIVNALTVDENSQETWQSFSLIGDVMRGEAPQTKEWDIAAKVALALDNEPAHTGMAPQEVAPVVQLADVREARTEPMESQPTPKQAKWTLPSWLTQLGQVAVAASVSLAVIVGVQQYNGNEPGMADIASGEQLPVLETIPFAGTAEPVSLTRDSVQANHRHAGPTEAQVMEQRRRINAMLQDYELQLRLNAEDGSIDRSMLEAN
ncbi:RseA family anti-sigma factor [Photobacterium aphoticum]|uniref:Anti-sigma-E factor RseA n=1 Tax=Photobacterium aphoticum TaxID=754436 RepID=A0A0J1JBJ1_9GAMM|nr:RseA family anti-sigma factor [Photobacterium aphoticum]KLU98966.1 anti-sigma E factor [Photobacterium aphoticum]PSU55164.1 anti-sigma E factor [Photobacterium aphoticum]GHA57057.1 anti-sigma-E factor RseA [Photobacterium aphoticum]